MNSQRVALVSGASRGIGRAVAESLRDQGITTLAGCRDPRDAPRGPGIRPIRLDITDLACVDEVRRMVLADYDRLDVLVNNAGIYPDRPGQAGLTGQLESLDPEWLTGVLDVNVVGAARLIWAFLPLMRRRGYGRIVNVSSGRGRFSDLDAVGPFYRISKTALNALTVVVAADAADCDILVNAVCPGWVRTDMGGPRAERSVDEAAAGVVWAACLPSGGPTGRFFRDGQPLDWCRR